jgi:hypothetical protein
VLAHTESFSPPAERFICGLTGKTAENAKKTRLKWKMNFTAFCDNKRYNI